MDIKEKYDLGVAHFKITADGHVSNKQGYEYTDRLFRAEIDGQKLTFSKALLIWYKYVLEPTDRDQAFTKGLDRIDGNSENMHIMNLKLPGTARTPFLKFDAYYELGNYQPDDEYAKMMLTEFRRAQIEATYWQRAYETYTRNAVRGRESKLDTKE